MPGEHLPDWIHHLETLVQTPICFGLERLQKLAEKLDFSTFSIPVITVTGTNGKGSVVGFIQQALVTSGYRVGCYTSPHLCRYNERIAINGEPLSDVALLTAFMQVEAARGDLLLTPFEYLTAAALWHFKQASLDFLILEVGCGGRLDAVNMVSPTLAILTGVDFDHLQWLGSTREAIGAEKSGIFRPGIPVVLGEKNPPLSVLAHATQLKCTVYRLGEQFSYQQAPEGGYFFYTPSERLVMPSVQIKPENAATACMALCWLKTHYSLNLDLLHPSLSSFAMPGRYQRFKIQEYTLVLDVAHNPQSIHYLNERLCMDYPAQRKRAIFGMLKDKDCLASIAPLKSTFWDWHLVDTEGDRGLPAETLLAQVQTVVRASCYTKNEVVLALESVLQNAAAGDVIVVFGSFHLVGKVLEWELLDFAPATT